MALEITTKLPAEQGLAEIYQSTNLKMALCRKLGDEQFERITPFVLCRDFLTDVFTYSKAKKDFGIYGMSFKGTKESADFSGVYLLMQLPDAKTAETLKKNLEHIVQMEISQGIPASTLKQVKGELYLLEGHESWVQNCLLFSLYSLLVRSLCIPLKGKKDWMEELCEVEGNTDCALLASVNKSVWKKIFANLTSICTDDFCGFDPNKEKGGVGAIHHNSGFISVFGEHREIDYRTVVTNSHWQEMKKRGFDMFPKSLKVA